jgi:hypothetical protein
VIEDCKSLTEYERLERIAIQTNMAGIPKGRAPLDELEKSGRTTADISRLLQPLRDFLSNRIRTKDSALLLDSATRTDADGNSTNVYQYDVEIVQGSATGLDIIGQAIARKQHDIARVFGADGLMLGGSASGSRALAEDKTDVLLMVVQSVLDEVVDAVHRDLLEPIWRLNGFPGDMMPSFSAEAVQRRDVEKLARVLELLGRSGLTPDDPAIDEIRAEAGLSPQLSAAGDLDAMLGGDIDGDEMPEDDEDAGQ